MPQHLNVFIHAPPRGFLDTDQCLTFIPPARRGDVATPRRTSGALRRTPSGKPRLARFRGTQPCATSASLGATRTTAGADRSSPPIRRSLPRRRCLNAYIAANRHRTLPVHRQTVPRRHKIDTDHGTRRRARTKIVVFAQAAKAMEHRSAGSAARSVPSRNDQVQHIAEPSHSEMTREPRHGTPLRNQTVVRD
jgi:hypothetical protein